ncbi:hypothetical protein [Chitinophaga sp. MM2321]|uniref:hypothetical protein n=1 Tax=Chitinophaga sp. MM2321 TaxID=3137178 RepID=UPI0032D58A9C
MKKILFLFLLVGLVYACKKDKGVGTKPILTFKSYSIDSVTATTEQMTVTLNVRDGDGDIEDTLAMAVFYDSMGTADSLYGIKKMPGIGINKGKSINADVILPLIGSDFLLGTGDRPNDSMHFAIYIIDNAGNSSDTISTPKIPYNRLP